jgi:hypothetical protein
MTTEILRRLALAGMLAFTGLAMSACEEPAEEIEETEEFEEDEE